MFDQLEPLPASLIIGLVIALVPILIAATAMMPILSNINEPIMARLSPHPAARSVARGRTRRRGSIKKRGENRWLIRVELAKGPNGERRRRSRVVHGPKEYANRELAKLLANSQEFADEGKLRPPDAAQLTVEDLFAKFFESYAEVKLQPSTVADYRRRYRLYVRPHLGHTRLDQLTPDKVRAYIEVLKTAPRTRAPKTSKHGRHSPPLGRGATQPSTLSITTVHAGVKILLAGLRYAFDNDYITEDVGAAVRNVCIKAQNAPLPPRERDAILSAACSDPDHWIHYPFMVLLAQTGLRPAEALTLRWSNVNWKRRQIYAVVSKSFRVVEMTPELVKILAWHFAVQGKLGMRDRKRDLMFTSKNGSPLDARYMVTNVIKTIARRIGIEKNITRNAFRYGFGTDSRNKSSNPTTDVTPVGDSSMRKRRAYLDRTTEEWFANTMYFLEEKM